MEIDFIGIYWKSKRLLRFYLYIFVLGVKGIKIRGLVDYRWALIIVIRLFCFFCFDFMIIIKFFILYRF